MRPVTRRCPPAAPCSGIETAGRQEWENAVLPQRMSGADAVVEHAVSSLEPRPSTGSTRGCGGEGAAAAIGAAGRSKGGGGALDKGAPVRRPASPGSTCASARLKRRLPKHCGEGVGSAPCSDKAGAAAFS
ncbi:hypothetical protein LZ32DRAFT_454116 [Colletotrichum eremochloae]|nr:hypothetical protein LZ32DRAFT_454116 [Colletotrichum eremochloae]